MTIRLATAEDIDRIMPVFDAAKQFMRSVGNHQQWAGAYPTPELILKNIEKKAFYLCLSDEGEPLAVFYFCVEADPTYARIDNGAWLSDGPYGVVHRMASNGKQKGIADFCFGWCYEQCHNVRVDTHRDNTVMQNALLRNGFVECGIIYIADGSERIAYQKC